jgi:hypothetical protein
MPVQLIISGDHVTDLIAEIHNLAEATGKQTAPVQYEAVVKVEQPTTASANVTSVAKTEVTKLNREEQDNAVEEMITAGQKDARFDMLTKGRQKAVEDGITDKKAVVEETTDLFGDEPEAPAEIINADTIRAMMGKKGKDEDGQPNQDNLLKIRDILTKFVPKGEEIKVGKIPADKLAAVYAELSKLEG